MNSQAETERVDHLAERVEELRQALQEEDPAELAARCGASYDTGAGALRLDVYEVPVVVDCADFVARDADRGAPLGRFLQTLLAYYFFTCDGTPPAAAWISFSELPDGTFYTAAFQSYTGHELSKAFGNDVEAFAQAARRAGGKAVPFADRALAFDVLPRVSLLVACWQGDEDFPASYRVLFDAAAGHYLTTDACAVLGSDVTRRILWQAKE